MAVASEIFSASVVERAVDDCLRDTLWSENRHSPVLVDDNGHDAKSASVCQVAGTVETGFAT